ncbi:MAG: dihydropteroate synthase [Haliscomenobacter sp.]|nr:dihydropteroate synthase [Haliscomenobacter sp.]MCF8318085.1 dihydropteroate synthase [Haliscomenobacter sp.]
MIHPKITLNLCGSLLVLENPVVMAVININTDSFYEKSRFTERGGILKQAETHLREGATFLDIGGMSSRPGAPISNAKDEVEKIVPVIKSLKKEFPDAFISIDTVHSAVASAAYQEGAVLVNDISAGAIDPDMFPFIAKTNIPYVLMHLKGVPRNMQDNTNYKDVSLDVLDFLILKYQALKELGVKDIIIDPGFGFGKDVAQNYELLQNLSIFKILECPLMVGLSRKSMIYKVIDGTPEDALHGTTALHFFALQQGALILRAHDVKPAIDTIRVWKALENAKTN